MSRQGLNQQALDYISDALPIEIIGQTFTFLPLVICLQVFYLSISLTRVPVTPISNSTHNMVQLKYTALSGTYMDLGRVKQCSVIFLLKEISSVRDGIPTCNLLVVHFVVLPWLPHHKSTYRLDMVMYRSVYHYFISNCVTTN